MFANIMQMKQISCKSFICTAVKVVYTSSFGIITPIPQITAKCTVSFAGSGPDKPLYIHEFPSTSLKGKVLDKKRRKERSSSYKC